MDFLKYKNRECPDFVYRSLYTGAAPKIDFLRKTPRKRRSNIGTKLMLGIGLGVFVLSVVVLLLK